jgi:septum formation protein
MPLVLLASRSPRRLDLLRRAGIDVLVRAADCDEAPGPGEKARPYARRIARAKLEAALAANTEWDAELPEDAVWLAADTVVHAWTDPAPIGKPRDREDAAAMLRALTAGFPHFVTTAWAVTVPGSEIEVHEETTRVFMRTVGDAELVHYLETQPWQDKAGAYAVQDGAAGWITRIEGSYTNVVGLPLAQVLERLAAYSVTQDRE